MSHVEKQKMKRFEAELVGKFTSSWVPVWARNVDEALAAAELEYGEDNVGRVRPKEVE